MKIRLIFAILALMAADIRVSESNQVARGREDCVPYDASTLRLTDEGPLGWLISRDDGARFIGMDNREDAEVMLAVFKRYKQFCYVGRNNKRANRASYVHHYWK